MRVGIADHFGWAVAITASADHAVVDRRRIELVEPGVSPAPMHYDSSRLDLVATEELVATVRASVARAAQAALVEIAAAVAAPIESISLRAIPPNFPTDISVLRRAPYEARADAVMYRQILADVAQRRDWAVHFYDAKRVIAEATKLLANRAAEVMDSPRRFLGPPWTNDHRMALAATVAAAYAAR